MGFNTAILILNDAIGEVDKNPVGWWTKTKQMIRDAAMIGRNGRHDYGFGNHANGFAVITVHHADETALVSIGGNMANVLGRFHTGGRGPGSQHHTLEGQVQLVKQWAEDNGYELKYKGPNDG